MVAMIGDAKDIGHHGVGLWGAGPAGGRHQLASGAGAKDAASRQGSVLNTESFVKWVWWSNHTVDGRNPFRTTSEALEG